MNEKQEEKHGYGILKNRVEMKGRKRQNISISLFLSTSRKIWMLMKMRATEVRMRIALWGSNLWQGIL